MNRHSNKEIKCNNTAPHSAQPPKTSAAPRLQRTLRKPQEKNRPMKPSPIRHIAAHFDTTMPERHYSKVFHRDHPGREIATFCDRDTHIADAEAFIDMSLQRDRYMAAIAKEIDHIPDAGKKV